MSPQTGLSHLEHKQPFVEIDGDILVLESFYGWVQTLQRQVAEKKEQSRVCNVGQIGKRAGPHGTGKAIGDLEITSRAASWPVLPAKFELELDGQREGHILYTVVVR